jgi:parafibromin
MSSSSSDPLLALKQAIDTKAPVSYISNGESVPTLSAATHLAISSPDTIFIKSTPTRLRKPGASSTSSPSNPTTHPGDFYSLEAVYLAWLTKDASGADYMKQARESGLAVGFVSVTERKRLVEWLEGSTTVHDGVAPLSGG